MGQPIRNNGEPHHSDNDLHITLFKADTGRFISITNEKIQEKMIKMVVGNTSQYF